MASTCVTPIDLCAIRATKLTEAGAPLTGASNGYLSIAPISLQVTTETEAGDDLTLKNGCGSLIASKQSPDTFKGITLALVLSQMDSYLLNILTGATLFTSGGNAIGLKAPAIGSTPPPVCLEAWTKPYVDDNQTTSTFTSPNVSWMHWVFPFTRWVLGDFTMENDFMQVPVNGIGASNTQITVNGPYNDWPSAVAAQGGVTTPYGWFYDTVFPNAETCDFVTVTSLAS